MIPGKRTRRNAGAEKQTAPPSLHLVVTPGHAGVVEAFLADLEKAVQEVRANPNASSEGMAAMYGMMAKIPEQGQVQDFILDYLDGIYKP